MKNTNKQNTVAKFNKIIRRRNVKDISNIISKTTIKKLKVFCLCLKNGLKQFIYWLESINKNQFYIFVKNIYLQYFSNLGTRLRSKFWFLIFY